MSSTPFEFAVKMGRVADNVKRTPDRIAERAAQTVKRSVQIHLAIAAPSGRLNVGKRGARVGVRYDLEPKKAIVRMTGPAHLLENTTKAHRIPRDQVGKGKQRRANKKIVFIPGVGVRAYANHPGTKGKKPWRKGVEAALPKLDEVAGEHYFDAMRKVF